MVSDMRKRSTTGPLTDRQHTIVQAVADGMSHADIAEHINVSRVCVSENLAVARLKMHCETTQCLIAQYTRYETYMAVAEKIRSGRRLFPIGEAEEHVNHVLDEMAAEYRKLALRILP